MKRKAFLVVLFSAVAAPAWGVGHPYTELEIPVPELTGSHARALGMGGAHIAVAEDASAILWNPAGLVNIRRIEIGTTLARGDQGTETTWLGTASDWNRAENQLAGLHFLYPFPTFRGSLVVGIGVDRLRDYTLRYKRSGVGTDIAFGEGEDPGSALLTDSELRDGKLSGYSAAVGWDAGPRLSFGGSLTYLRGSIYDEQVFLTEDVYAQSPTYRSYEDYYLLDAKISGITGMVGFLYKASPRVRFGGVLGAPRWISIERFEQYRLRDRYDDGSELIEYEDIPVYDDEEITFPYWLGFGVSVAAENLLLAADIRHTDWREIDDQIGSAEVLTRPYYRDGTSFSIGAEATVPRIPLRFRAGYRYDPAPFVLTYCPTGDCAPDARDPNEVEIAIDKERQFVALGAGYLFDSVLAVDVTYEAGRYERASDDPARAPYAEKRTSDSLLLSVGYRF